MLSGMPYDGPIELLVMNQEQGDLGQVQTLEELFSVVIYEMTQFFSQVFLQVFSDA